MNENAEFEFSFCMLINFLNFVSATISYQIVLLKVCAT